MNLKTCKDIPGRLRNQLRLGTEVDVVVQYIAIYDQYH